MTHPLQPSSTPSEQAYQPRPFHYHERPERSTSQAVRDFVSEVLAILVDPLSDALTSNPFEDEDEPDSLSTVDSSLFRELSRSSWGQALVQGGQFKSLIQSLEDHVKRQERADLQAVRPQRIIHDA